MAAAQVEMNKRKQMETKEKRNKRMKNNDPRCEGSSLYVVIGNCVARKLFPDSTLDLLNKKYPYFSPYDGRTDGPYPNLAAPSLRGQLGSIEIRSPPDVNKPTFCVLYAQYRMGSTKSEYFMTSSLADEEYKITCTEKDSKTHRLVNFQLGLSLLADILQGDNFADIDTIIFPRTCSWEWAMYKTQIDNFESQINSGVGSARTFKIKYLDI